VLPTDTLCWHCGYQLPKRPAAKPAPVRPAAAGLPDRQAAGNAAAGEYDFRALAVYGLLTLAIIVALLWVMRSLNDRPILVQSAAFELGDWVSLTDVDLRYTLSVPGDWQWLDVAYRDQSQMLADVMDRQIYVRRALRSLAHAADDVAIVGLAVGSQSLELRESLPFVVIGRSEQLGALTPEQALELVAEQPPAANKAVDTHLSDQPQARFNITDLIGGYNCRHLFTTQDGVGYLVAACAPQERFGVMLNDLDRIRDSFQLLEH
jgi:hypothetical protein